MLSRIFLKKAKKIHFVGIGGISMSALAKLLLRQGKEVTGSDIKASAITNELKTLGIRINIKHKAKAVDGADIVVYTGAINEKNVELQRARLLGIKMIERSTLLSIVSQEYKNVIAIAGAHGKTTTTAMLAKVMIDSGLDPTVHLGGEVDFLGGNLKIGGEEYFITEACEYNRSFLTLRPDYSIILNVEPEHLDTYGTFENVKKAFKNFAKNTSKKVIYNKNYILDITKDFATFDLYLPCDYYVKNLKNNNGCYSFDVFKHDKYIHSFSLNVPGLHNVYNALAVISIADTLTLDMKAVSRSLQSFTGVKRRYEMLGVYNNATIIADYAHHPTEISCLLDAIRGFYDGELTIVFQPHTFSRTKAFFDDFINVLSRENIDNLILLPTYSAREKPEQGKSALDIYKAMPTKKKAKYAVNFGTLLQEVNKISSSKSMIVFVGAGNVYDFACRLLK